MKKFYLIVFSLLILFEVKPQSNSSLGVKTGIGRVFVDFDPTLTSTAIGRIQYGIFFLTRNERFGFQTEANIFGKSISFSTRSSVSTQTLRHLEIPILFKLYIVGGIGLEIGPQITTLLSVESPVPGSDELFQRSKVSFATGITWDSKFGLQMNLRYVNLANNLLKEEGEHPLGLKTFQFMLGYRILRFGEK